jgi:hypothetical protein
VSGTAKGFEGVGVTTVSFPIPLKEPPLTDATGAAVQYIAPGEGEGEENESSFIKVEHVCGGTAANPSAAPGHLCLFAAEAEDVNIIQSHDLSSSSAGDETIGKTGAGIKAIAAAAGTASVSGSWAVTAE